MHIGRTLILLGVILIIAGLLYTAGSKLGLGRLPGDIIIKKGNTTFYFPLVTSIIISLVLSLLFSIFRGR